MLLISRRYSSFYFNAIRVMASDSVYIWICYVFSLNYAIYSADVFAIVWEAIYINKKFTHAKIRDCFTLIWIDILFCLSFNPLFAVKIKSLLNFSMIFNVTFCSFHFLYTLCVFNCWLLLFHVFIIIIFSSFGDLYTMINIFLWFFCFVFV